MAHRDVRIGKRQIESVITGRSAELLGLKKGDKVKVVIKSTELRLPRVGSPHHGREAAIRCYKYRRCRTLGSLIVQLRNRSSSSLSARVKRSC